MAGMQTIGHISQSNLLRLSQSLQVRPNVWNCWQKMNSTIFYRDFAHAPSKVKATIEAVKQQFPEKKLYCHFGTAYIQQFERSLYERI